jgi:hypothetical protein
VIRPAITVIAVGLIRDFQPFEIIEFFVHAFLSASVPETLVSLRDNRVFIPDPFQGVRQTVRSNLSFGFSIRQSLHVKLLKLVE